jgi:Flp pilus assembly protein TadD
MRLSLPLVTSLAWCLGILCQAKTLYRQALDRQPEDTRALSNLGSILTIEGQDDEAMVQLTHALRLGPTSSEVLGNLASLHHVSAASLCKL